MHNNQRKHISDHMPPTNNDTMRKNEVSNEFIYYRNFAFATAIHNFQS